ncbi:hypothetical protein ABPG73_019092 [Tetrahymena malaccensis]
MKKSLILALVALLNIYICQSNNSAQQICQTIRKQGVECTSQDNNISINGPNNVNIALSLENVTTDVYFTIQGKLNINFEEINLRNVVFDLKNQSFIQFNGIQSLVINQFRFDNVTMSTPIFDAKSCNTFEFLNGFVKNCYLQQGFGNFSQISNFSIKNKIVDINTIYNLNENFYNLYNVGNVYLQNCTFGNTQRSYQNIDPIGQYKLQGEKIFKNLSYQRDLNFIKLFQNQESQSGAPFIFDSIIADFENLNIRFILISDMMTTQIHFMNSQFMNMKNIDSGGCISNFANTQLVFSNTLFDSCQSGMFGGAIFSSSLKIIDQITIRNCKSKIGGGVFSGHKAYSTIDIEKVNFANNSNTATISSQQYFICTHQPDFYKYANCNLFEIDSIYELNTDLVNTQYYQVQMEIKIKDMGTPPHIIYTSTIYQNIIYLIRLRVEYECPEQTLCSLREFDENQKIGNLYNYLDEDQKKYFYNFDIPNVNYPYVLTSYNEGLDCQPYFKMTYIFRFNFFKSQNIYTYPKNSRFGCYNLANDCRKGMQKIVNTFLNQEYCKYCDIGTYSRDPENNCEICDVNKFDKCYANYSSLKQGMWRPQYSQYDDTHFCQLNQQSCNSDNRQGYGNTLCSEGYIGAQCLTCDINGEFWNGDIYGLKEDIFLTI